MATPREHMQADILWLFTNEGDEASVSAGSLRVMFRAPGQVLENFGGLIVDDPTALASDQHVAAYGITGGEYGTTITINGVDYRVLAIVPNGFGISLLTLEMA
ncbi:MAG: hypothetical protein PHZ02_07255 [Desulfocapsaceae bacterium]|nr:hypothetical protein [Desulfocapsaceae bacterium]